MKEKLKKEMAVQVERCTPFFRTIYFKLQQQQQQQQLKSAAAWAEPTGEMENGVLMTRCSRAPAVRTQPLTVGPISSRSLVVFLGWTWFTLDFSQFFFLLFFSVFKLIFTILGFAISSQERDGDCTRCHSTEQREWEENKKKWQNSARADSNFSLPPF